MIHSLRNQNCKNAPDIFRRYHFVLIIGILCVSPLLSSCKIDQTAPIEGWQTELNRDAVHEDYPWVTLDHQRNPWVIYVEHDGENDHLKLARQNKGKLTPVATLAGPGMIHRPRLVRDGNDTLHAVWSQRASDQRWVLNTRTIVDGTPQDSTRSISSRTANHVFSDTAAGPDGNVWVTWQMIRDGKSDVRLRRYNSNTKQWSAPQTLNNRNEFQGNGWRPRVACDGKGNAHVLYEYAENGNFDLNLARVQPDGSITQTTIVKEKSHDSFAELATTPDGTQLYITWEQGKKHWGRNSRSHRFSTGLNTNKKIGVRRVSTDYEQTEPLPPIKPQIVHMIGGLPAVGSKDKLVVNQPQVVVDGNGVPWLFVRWARRAPNQSEDLDYHQVWQIAVMKYDRTGNRWSNSFNLNPSSLSQDRLISAKRGPKGHLFLTWPSDNRRGPRSQNTGIYLARFDTSRSMSYPETLPDLSKLWQKPPLINPSEEPPDQNQTDRYEVRHQNQTYGLYWGDVHRHTDLSPDLLLWDGTATEHYRYAYELANLDFMATSDHTDIGPGPFQPYEWWQVQKISNYMTSPKEFLGLYGYEREQGHPWGHRNVIFAEMGGPVVYISRKAYRQSKWAEQYPVGDGGKEITPQELWNVLRDAGKPVTVISHTSAKSYGSVWSRYDHIDHRVENVLEIFQGARVSYEAKGAPQPTVGLDSSEESNQIRTGKGGLLEQETNAIKKWGTFQAALREGHRLGVVASSDHISTNTSFAGVYTDDFTRTGLVKAINNRHTIAATDKIHLFYTCNGHLLGEAFTTHEKPELNIDLEATGPVKRIVIIRNEEKYKVYEPENGQTSFDLSFTDSSPVNGENRYYLRVIQNDGNMAWASPVWVTYKP